MIFIDFAYKIHIAITYFCFRFQKNYICKNVLMSKANKISFFKSFNLLNINTNY